VHISRASLHFYLNKMVHCWNLTQMCSIFFSCPHSIMVQFFVGLTFWPIELANHRKLINNFIANCRMYFTSIFSLLFNILRFDIIICEFMANLTILNVNEGKKLESQLNFLLFLLNIFQITKNYLYFW
jgi:hypothetical protein